MAPRSDRTTGGKQSAQFTGGSATLQRNGVSTRNRSRNTLNPDDIAVGTVNGSRSDAHDATDFDDTRSDESRTDDIMVGEHAQSTGLHTLADETRTQRARDAGRAIEAAFRASPSSQRDTLQDRNLPLTSSLGASVIGLVRTIEDEILPRLRLALDSVAGVPAAMRPTYEQVGELARLSITREDAASLQYVEGLLQAGMTVEVVYEELLSAAARRLGEFWVEDACDFSDVTVGTIRLQKIQRALSRQMRQSGSGSAATAVSKLALRRALILPMPGEQHTFGATIVQEFFARAGWQVEGYPPVSETELVNMVRAESYDMIGLCLSRDDRLQELAACVTLVRRASRNKNVVIAVGGPPFVVDPLRASAVGADATGASGAEAVAAVDAAISRHLQPA